jgi:hypothetical protein
MGLETGKLGRRLGDRGVDIKHLRQDAERRNVNEHLVRRE